MRAPLVLPKNYIFAGKNNVRSCNLGVNKKQTIYSSTKAGSYSTKGVSTAYIVYISQVAALLYFQFNPIYARTKLFGASTKIHFYFNNEVEALQGKIEIETYPDEGTIFRFILPNQETWEQG